MRRRSILTILIIALAILMADPMSRVDFVTVDDSLAELEVRAGTDLWDYAWSEAREWGRLQIAAYHLASFVPHLPGNGWGFQLIKIVSTFGAALVFCLVAQLLAGTWRVGALCGVMFLCLTQNSWYHNLLNAYPFVFDLPFAVAMASIAFAFLHVRRGGWWWLVLEAVCFLVAIWIYETFLPFVAIVAIVAAVVRPKSGCEEDGAESDAGAKDIPRSRRLWAGLIPLAVAVCYLVAYGIYKGSTEGTYTGYSTGQLVSLVPLQVLGNLTFGGVPFSQFVAYVKDPSVDSVMMEEFASAGGTFFGHLRDHFKIEWLVKALLAGMATWLCLSRKPNSLSDTPASEVSSGRAPIALGWLVVIAGLLMVLPNLIISLIAKYQEIYLDSERPLPAHTTSCYTQFGFYLFAALIAVILLRALSKWPRVRAFAAGTVALMVAGSTLATSYWNDHVFRDQALAGEKWSFVDQVLASDDFAKLPNDAIIYAPTLWEGRGILGQYDDYWSRYFNIAHSGGSDDQVSDIRVHRQSERFLDDLEGYPDRRRYFMSWAQDDADRQFLSLARLWVSDSVVPDSELLLGSDRASVWISPRSEPYTIAGMAFPHEDGRLAKVTHVDVRTRDWFSFQVSNLVEHVDLRSSWLFPPESLVVRDAGPAVRSQPIEIAAWRGFHPREFVKAENEWLRWTGAGDDKATGVVLRNRFPYPVEVSLTTSFRPMGARTVHVGLPGHDEPSEFVFTGEADERLFLNDARFVLPVGDTFVPITSDRPSVVESVAPEGEEARALAVQCYPWELTFIQPAPTAPTPPPAKP